MFFSPADFFKKNSFRNTISVKQFGSRVPDQARHFVRVWVQTVCKSYQQTTLVGNELILKVPINNTAEDDNICDVFYDFHEMEGLTTLHLNWSAADDSYETSVFFDILR